MHLVLHRVSIIEAGAFGVLLWQDVPFAVTVEHTYSDGQRGTQTVKIPIGSYECVRSRYNKGGYDCWQIVGGIITPNRRILIHKGNLEDDSEGCVLVGEQFGELNGKPAILQSGAAFSELMALTANYDVFQLAVIN